MLNTWRDLHLRGIPSQALMTEGAGEGFRISNLGAWQLFFQRSLHLWLATGVQPPMYLAKLPVRGGPGASSAPGIWRPRSCIEVGARGLRFMVISLRPFPLFAAADPERAVSFLSCLGNLDSVVWTFNPALSRHCHGPILSIALWHLVFNCTGFSQCVRSCPVVRSTEHSRGSSER